jgi:hypothetical protein
MQIKGFSSIIFFYHVTDFFTFNFEIEFDCIGGVMISVLASSVVDCVFDPTLR